LYSSRAGLEFIQGILPFDSSRFFSVDRCVGGKRDSFMAQTTYTLEEAATKLGISPEDLKRRLREEWKHIRSFRDGSTLRFRANDIDELARTIGVGSDPEAPILTSSTDLELPSDLAPPPGDSVTIHQPHPGKNPKSTARASDVDIPLVFDDADSDEFALAPDPQVKPSKPSTSKLIGQSQSKPDSDVRLEKQTDRPSKKKTVDDDEESILTEGDIDLEPSSKSGKLSGKSSSGKSSGKLASGKSGKLSTGGSGTKIPPPPQDDSDSSEFELSLDSDSSGEFELALGSEDSSEEISLGDIPVVRQSGSNSGINLDKPADSGPSLEKKKKDSKKKIENDSDEIDFVLSVDKSASGKKTGGKIEVDDDSDSEFELTLDEDAGALAADLDVETGTFTDENQNKDIFETDFEIPALDQEESGSEVLSLDEADTDLESSDFDLEMRDTDSTDQGESGSEIVELEDEIVQEEVEEAPAPKAKKKKKTLVLDDDDGEAVSLGDLELDEEEEASASKALRGVKAKRLRGIKDEDEIEEEEEEEEGAIVVAKSVPWGPLPALMLLPCVLVLFVGAIMAYEVVHGMWGYAQSSKPSSLVVEGVSDLLGIKPKE
jgi:hypothetical protein